MEQIYSLDISEAQAVDTSAEGSDTGDTKITIWGQTYTKANFVTEYNKIANDNLATNVADDKLIAAVNKLSNYKEDKLKTAVESYVSE